MTLQLAGGTTVLSLCWSWSSLRQKKRDRMKYNPHFWTILTRQESSLNHFISLSDLSDQIFNCRKLKRKSAEINPISNFINKNIIFISPEWWEISQNSKCFECLVNLSTSYNLLSDEKLLQLRQSHIRTIGTHLL